MGRGPDTTMGCILGYINLLVDSRCISIVRFTGILLVPGAGAKLHLLLQDQLLRGVFPGADHRLHFVWLEHRLAVVCLVGLIVLHIDLAFIWLIVPERCRQYDAIVLMEPPATLR